MTRRSAVGVRGPDGDSVGIEGAKNLQTKMEGLFRILQGQRGSALYGFGMRQLVTNFAEAIELRTHKRGIGERQKERQGAHLEPGWETFECASARAPVFNAAIQSIFETDPTEKNAGAQAQTQPDGCAGNGRQTFGISQKSICIIERAELHDEGNLGEAPVYAKFFENPPLWKEIRSNAGLRFVE